MSDQTYNCPECGKAMYYDGLCYDCKVQIEFKQTLALSDAEVKAKVEKIVEDFNEITSCRQVSIDFMNLFCYREINTEKIAEKALENKIFDPDILYKNASAEVRDRMIELLKENECEEANNIQCALAVLGDDKVLEAFIELEKNPREWREKLYVNPSVYAYGGGWTFDESGNKIELTYRDCYALEKSERKDDAVILGKVKEDTCPKCGGKIIDLLTIDGRDERLNFLGINGLIKASGCPDCIMMSSKTFCKYTINGESELLENDEGTDECYAQPEDYEKFANNGLVLSTNKVNPYFGSNEDTFSTIGGMPNWIQDPTYLTCPVCEKKMKYFAQLHSGKVLNYAEGTLFFEICQDCHTIGMIHQQT
jgi:hypothetical protein